MSILEYTALELAGQIKKKEISCREAVEAVFGQIEKKEKELNCYISLDREEALKQADEVQKKSRTEPLPARWRGCRRR